MDVILDILEDEKFKQVKKHISNLNIINDKNGISFNVRCIDDGENPAPHEGYINFTNNTSQALFDAVTLLYKIIGMLYEDRLVRGKCRSVMDQLPNIEKELIKYKQEIKKYEEQIKEDGIKFSCVENVPNITKGVLNKLNKLRNEVEDHKVELEILKQKWKKDNNEDLRTEYFDRVKKFRPKIIELNKLVDLVNDKYVKKLTCKIDLDKHTLDLDQVKLKYETVLEKAKFLLSQNDKVTPELIYLSKRLGFEEDYEL